MPRRQTGVNVLPGQVIVTLDADELDEIADALMFWRDHSDDRAFCIGVRKKIVKRSRMARRAEDKIESGRWVKED